MVLLHAEAPTLKDQRSRAEIICVFGRYKRRTNAYLFRIGFSVLVASGFYAYVSRIIAGISG